MQHDLGAVLNASRLRLAGRHDLKPAPPVETHSDASADPARRLKTSMQSATMNAE
jgi:hypothetical protein